MRLCSRVGFALYFSTLLDVFGQRHWRSSNRYQRKTWEVEATCIQLRNPVCTAGNGGQKGDTGKTATRVRPRVGAELTAEGRRSLEPTLCSEGALSYGGKKAEIEKLWRDFFLDPTEWWDHRSDKPNLRFPDFVHKKTAKGLWVNSNFIPPWVEARLAALPSSSSAVSSNFSWNQRLSNYAQAGQYEKTMDLFQQMQREEKPINRFTFLPVLKACANLGLLEHGQRIHTMMPPGFDSDVFIGSSLVDMYAKCGSIEEAERVFNQIPAKNVVAWNAMIGGYVKCGEGRAALDLFEQMQRQGVAPVPITFVGVLNACASVATLEGGRRVHEEIIRRGYESNVFVGNCLVDMYAKCGSMEEAERVFNGMRTRNVVAWTAMIGGYVKSGEGQKALEVFEQMQRQGVAPDRVTFLGVLNACAGSAALEGGRRVHDEIIRRGYESNIFVGNCLVDMYAKCGSIDEAERVFHMMPAKDVVAWNAMILGYVKCEEGQKALELFEQMKQQGVAPDTVTFMGVLNACASLAALEEGRLAHEEIINKGYEADVFVGNSLVDMYAKCGSIEDAERVFNKMPTRDVVAWNALLAAYSIHGLARKALETFKQMWKTVEVNAVTFTSLLSACSHGGLVAEGLETFKSMSAVYNITPTLEHFACVVDLLGRAGRLGEAEDLVLRMPMDPDVTVWMSLLGACRVHVNVEVGERCAKRVLELDPENSAAQVLLSNIYVAAGKFDSSTGLSAQRLCKDVTRIPGRAWIEVNNKVHSFVVDDDLHPQILEICAELKRLSSQMKDCQYVLDTRCLLDTRSLQVANEEGTELHFCHHSEKLAIAFGLISTAPVAPLRVVKNLPVCSDCHTDTKFIAKMIGRAITVRDANQFHHFKGGLCSCRDYW